MPTRRVMVDHLTVGVSDLARSRDFYERALAPLGFGETSTSDVLPSEIGFGSADKMDFAISTYATGAPVHIAFSADSIEQVQPSMPPRLPPRARKRASRRAPALRRSLLRRVRARPDGHNVEAVFHVGG